MNLKVKRQDFLNKIALMDDEEFNNTILKLLYGNTIPPISYLWKDNIKPTLDNALDEEQYYKNKARELALQAAQAFALLTTPISLGYRSITPEEIEFYTNKYKTDSKETLDLYAKDSINWENDFKKYPDWAEEEKTKQDYARWQLDRKDFEDRYNKTLEYISLGKLLNAACIYNALKAYGKTAYTNTYFREHPEEYGFTLTSEAPLIGDVYSSGHHMIMYTGNDDNGKPLYTWARGNELEGMVNNGYYPLEREPDMLHYTFVGTEEDKNKWKHEKENKPEKKELGGTLNTIESKLQSMLSSEDYLKLTIKNYNDLQKL